MTKASDNLFPKVILNEAATDGSDFSNPTADYRVLFLGEDGALHLKDSAGTVTAIGGGAVATDAIWDAKGDLAVGTGSDAAQKLTAGTNGHFLRAASGETTGLKWASFPTAVEFVIDGGGAEIEDGVAGDVQVPFACTITAARLLADQSGAIVVDIWKDTYGNYPPTDADSITSATPPTIAASGVKSEDTTLTSWTTTISAGDILRFNVDSCTTIERCTVVLAVTLT